MLSDGIVELLSKLESIWSQKDSTADKESALYVANPPHPRWSSRPPTELIPKQRAKSKP